jgi:hypothetical protein
MLADSDYNRLLEDLIVDQARTWAMNRYAPGSASRVMVAHDPTGVASKIMAKYLPKRTCNALRRGSRKESAVLIVRGSCAPSERSSYATQIARPGSIESRRSEHSCLTAPPLAANDVGWALDLMELW